jgi:two-component system, NarL family, sensor histidine kinase UhpB
MQPTPSSASPLFSSLPKPALLVPALAVASLLLLVGLIWIKADLLSRIIGLTPTVTANAMDQETLYQLNVQVLLMQTSRRGFVITGRQEHLVAFEQAFAKANTLLADLRAANEAGGASSPKHVAPHVAKLDELLPAYVTRLRQSIRLRIEEPQNDAEQSRLTDEGVAMSRQLIDALGATTRVMNKQLQTHVERLGGTAARAQTAEAWLAGITLATVALGFGVAGIQMQRRAAMRRKLEHANQTLEQRVNVRTAALSESEQRYRSLVELSADAVLLVHRSLTVAYANAAARVLMQRLGRSVVVGQSIDVLLGALLWESPAKVLEPLWREPAALPSQTAVLRGPQRLEVPVQWTAASHAASADDTEPHGLQYVQIIIHDLTELRKNEAAAHERMLFIDQLIEAIPVPVSVRNDQGRFLQVNAAFEASYQTDRQRVLQQTPFDLLPDSTAWHLTRQDAQASRSTTSVEYEFALPLPDGSSRDMLARAHAIRRADGSRQGVVTVETDITPLRQQEQALSKANDELARLTSDLRQTQETERRHIARELHDQVGQTMTALKLSIGQLTRDAGVPREVLQSRLDMVDEALNHTRNLSRALHPHVLEDLGLAAALDWLVEQFVSPAVAKMEQDVSINPARSDPHHELTAFRVAQEALTNAVRHANARSVRLQAFCQDGRLHLMIADDGGGFAKQAQGTRKPVASLGLVGMRERVLDVGGELRIDSSPDHGTVVSAVIDWPQA